MDMYEAVQPDVVLLSKVRPSYYISKVGCKRSCACIWKLMIVISCGYIIMAHQIYTTRMVVICPSDNIFDPPAVGFIDHLYCDQRGWCSKAM